MRRLLVSFLAAGLFVGLSLADGPVRGDGMIPFLAITGKPTEAEVRAKVAAMHAQGIDSFLIYARSGLELEYMGEEWLTLNEWFCDEAEKRGMKVWLYDEYNWPSGTCKGRVPNENDAWRYAEYGVYRNADGSYRWTTALAPAGWVNVCEPAAVARFIELTHEVYAKRLARWFKNKTVLGIFTDEPGHPTRVTFPDGKPLVSFRTYSGLDDEYRAATGRELKADVEKWLETKEGLSSVALAKEDGVWSIYMGLMGKRFRSAYFDQLRNWCDAHGILLTGHMICENDIYGSARYNGNPILCLRGETLPGMDEIGTAYGVDARPSIEWVTYNVARQAVLHRGNGGLAELFACGPANHVPATLRFVIWMCALHGIDHYITCMDVMDEKGLVEKHGYLAPAGPIHPWYEKYAHVLADEARVAAAWARKAVAEREVAVRYPNRLAAELAVAGRTKAVPGPGLYDLLKTLETNQFTCRLVDEDESTDLPLVFVCCADGRYSEERTCSTNLTAAAALSLCRERLPATFRVLERDGTPAADVLVRTFSDGSSAVLNLLAFTNRTLVAEREGRRTTFHLPARGIVLFAPQTSLSADLSAIALATADQTPQPLSSVDWNLSLSAPNIRRVNFDETKKGSLVVAAPLKGVRLVTRDCAMSYAVTDSGRPIGLNEQPAKGDKVIRHIAEPYVFEMDGSKVVPSEPCTSLRPCYNPLYRQTEPLDLAAGEHRFAIASGEADGNFFLPALFVVGDFVVFNGELSPRPHGKVRLGSLAANGLGDFTGTATWSAEVTAPKGSGIRLRLATGGRVTRVKFAGRDLGVRAWAPFEWKIPADLAGGNGLLEIAVSTSVQPMFGDVSGGKWDMRFWNAVSGPDGPCGLISAEWVVEAALCTGAAVADVIPLERNAWECVNPLGGDFTNGTYVSLHSAAQGFELAKDVPIASNIVVEAVFTPGRIEGSGFKTAGVALCETEGRFWHLALVESPTKYRFFELSEMRDGMWLAHKDLKMEINEKHGSWKTGEKYRLRLEMDGKGVEGAIRGEDGRLVFRCRFALKPGAVGCGRPAIKCYTLAGVYSEVCVNYSNPLVRRSHLSTVALAKVDGEGGSNPSNFYHTVRDHDGRWWFVDPDGKRFFLNGIGMVNHMGHYSAALGYAPYARAVQRKYPTLEDWATNTLARLKSWGFNMLSSSSGELLRRGMPHADVLAIGQDFSSCGDEFDILPCDGGPCTGFPNVFHPKWEAYCRYIARKCAANRNDRWVLGWYIDNELAWWGDRRKFRSPPSRGLFDACARKASGHSARAALDAFLKERGIASPEAATEDVTREFIRIIARRYFESAARAIREADPNHLVLGCRFAGLPSSDPVVWEECGRFCDVVSFNTYPLVDLDRGIALNGLNEKARPVAEEMVERAKIAGKPFIVTEWSFVALDSGLPCMHGAGQRFFTQRERAQATSILARTFYALPECAGYVYFMWSDQPKVGRSGETSENCNYGLVDADDNPWPEQVAALSEVQNNSAKWRYEPLPRDRPVAKPSAGAVAKALSVPRSPFPGSSVAALAKADPRFTRGDDGTFSLSNGIVLLSGRIGAEDVSVDGKGLFSPSIREYARGSMWWSGASEVKDVRGGVKGGLGAAEVTFLGKTKAGPFEMAVRFYLPAGRPFFLAELVRIVNRGAQALPVDEAFLRLVPAVRDGVQVAQGDERFEPPKEGQPTPIPPQLWRPWQSGAWQLADGACLGVMAPRLTGVRVSYWKDSNLHPDAYVQFPRVEIAPGESFGVPDRPFVVGAHCRGGISEWRAISSEIQKLATY